MIRWAVVIKNCVLSGMIVKKRMLIPGDFWPASLRHLTIPYLHATGDEVIIAEISSEPASGYLGMRQLYI
jgi:hypothetical protein